LQQCNDHWTWQRKWRLVGAVVLLLLHGVRHQLLLGALRADDVLPVCDESLPNHAGLAGAADEAVVVPVSSLEGDESSSTNSSNRFATGSAPLREKFSKAISTVRFVVSGCEPLSSQRLLTMSTSEALPVPGIISVGDSTLGYHLAALNAFCSELFFVALRAVNIVLLGNEAFGPNRILASAAYEAFFVPLSGLVLHLLHSGLEHVSTSITASGELCIIAGTTVYSVSFGPKLFVNQTGPALITEEAGLMPVFLLV